MGRVEGTSSEGFVNHFFPSLVPLDFVPLGGTKDGGADAFVTSGVFERRDRPTHFFQASIELDPSSKIRRTLRAFVSSAETWRLYFDSSLFVT